MKRTLSIALLTICLQVGAEAPPTIKDPAALIGNEIARLDTLIQATEKSLEEQKQLRAQIVEYQKLQDRFLAKSEDNELLLKLVKSAHRTLNMIKSNNLTQTFDPDFIDELSVLSQPARKRGLPKP
jgi:hypothetical protein